MATILLQAAGAFLGGVFGPVGSAIGAAAGALAGYTIDQALINGTRRIEGPRLTGARPFTAEEGVSLPRIYGTVRAGGIMIWATRFDEKKTTRRQGKTGPRVTEYTYFANVGFALCEGPIAGIRRVWADGREVDRDTIELRVHTGSESQPADPLVEAKQGDGETPAYRGVAYVVLEHFDLADYGNRIPQFQFEVLRPVGSFGKHIKAVSLIPGATEYGLSPDLVKRQVRAGQTEAVNRHVLHQGSDLAASLDELQMLCPNLEHVAVVAAWFGDDLRAGACRIRPAVTSASMSGFSEAWKVSGIARGSAMVVSTHAGGAAYGGTPSDKSLMEAIEEIKGRGLKVTLYPFIMMDIPAGNALPDPYGGLSQPPYPWRGRITSHPAPLRPDSADGTALARIQVEAFCGSAEPGDFHNDGDTIAFTGSPADWGYRRFVLHHARLAVAAGGVDAFLIGTELRGLTTLRDESDAFPFVEQLCEIAADVQSTVGPATKITYGADWSEYFGHHPADGTGDVYFHLDPLWAHPAIDAVGIDNYMPLSDWRDGDYASANPDGFSGPCDPVGLRSAITGGEGFDWSYPTHDARVLRERAPIEDGAFGKPWVFRYKDLASWWGEPHHNRIGGVEAAAPTAWTPRSKPIWFTELGCPAIDKGPNQPNVFSDPKSSEAKIPYFSSGGRSDLAQQRFIEAHAAQWDAGHSDFDAADNPLSPVYGERMVDASRIYLWAWDARPFPAFPLRDDQWSDGGNWHYGHWLNGRVGNQGVGDLINVILADHGLEPALVDGADGTVHGYVISDPTSARAALEPITELFGLSVVEAADRLVFSRQGSQTAVQIDPGELVSDARGAVLEAVRTPDHQLPTDAVLSFRDPFAEYQTISVRNARFGASGSRQHTIGFPGVLEAGQARALLGDWMRRVWSEREQISFSVTQPRADIVPGATIRMISGGPDFLVTEVEDGLSRRVAARQIARTPPEPWRSENPGAVVAPNMVVGQPLALFLDLPASGGADPANERFRVAAWQKPWKSQTVFASPEETGFLLRATLDRPADLGELAEALGPGFSGRPDHSSMLTIALFEGEPESVSRLQLLNGANVIAIRSLSGAWEIVQFETAEEIEPQIWRMSGLLRGQLGTEDAAAAGAEAGAYCVFLDDAVRPAGLLSGEAGLLLNWRVGPAGSDLSSANFSEHAEIGGMRAQLPLAPVHLRAERTAEGDVALAWIRRGRIDADNWTAIDIPLGEDREEYQVEIADISGAVVRTETVQQTGFLYQSTDIAADFDIPPAEIDVTVRQLSVAVGWGLPATRRFLFP